MAVVNHVAVQIGGAKPDNDNTPRDPSRRNVEVKGEQGTHHLQFGGGGYQRKDRVETTTENGSVNPSSVVGTARSAGGRPLAPGEVQPDSRVRYQGCEMLASAAERMGLIRRSPAGGYVDSE